jgi:hypothetical protein
MPLPANSDELKRIAAATADLGIAQREVERVMTALTADVPRAQKTIITEALRLAFEKLAGARATLTELTDEAEKSPP